MFLVAELPGGEDAVLDGHEGHHAATVRRMRTGEELVLGDGRGGTARCRITGTGRDRLELLVLERHRQEPRQPRVLLAQALIKGERGERAIEAATEAGVDALLPWRAARCVARWDDERRTQRGLARWRDAAAAAAKQARRSWVPEVSEPVSTGSLVANAAEAAAAVVLHESAAAGLDELALPDTGDLLVVVGPEGGVTPEELDVFAAAGVRPVRLGPEVLRADTAAAVAMGAIGVLTPRW